jgi:2-oxoglutarate ferredoxin oxidoreductase subunit beta
MLHALRRNVDLQILLFNNEIYGLTKGQYSPTSRRGTRSPSTPMGSIDLPLSPAQLAIGAGGRFVARGVDTQQKELLETLKAAHAHKGTSFVEIFQNCLVYNDGVFDSFTEKSIATERQIHVAHGQPLIFGKERNRGLRLNVDSLALEAVTIGEGGVGEDDILVHDETNRALALMLAALEPPEMPMAMGVLYSAEEVTYETAVMAQIEAAKAKAPKPDVNALLRGGATWTV